MADQFSALELLLDPEDQLADPIKRKATAAALRRQNAYGTLGQLMGVQPTAQVGQALQQGAQDSLKLALQKQQAAKEAAMRSEERKQAQENWQRTYDRGVFEFNNPKPTSRAPVVERFTGETINGRPGRRSNLTGEWTPDDMEQPKGAEGGEPTYGFNLPPGLAPKTETQQAAFTFATRMSDAVPQVEAIIQNGYLPSARDLSLLAVAGQSPRAAPFIEQGISKEGRIYMDAAAPLVNAILRKESGAAITAEEWTRAFREWLPRPGEDPAITQNKLAKLRKEMTTMATLSGMGQYYTPPPFAFGQQRGGSGSWQAPTQGGQQAAPQDDDKYFD